MKRLAATFAGLFLAATLLSACSLDCDTSPNKLEVAAAWPHTSARSPLPHDSWAENPGLQEFLREALKTEGIGSVAAKYGMQCIPSARDTGCADCFSCTKTIKYWMIDTVPLMWKCDDWGEVLVRVDAGPDSSIKAMTYWKTTPQARKAIARGATIWRD